ncbi:MAG TPA: hypothetical protein VN726_13865 [Hanamia sp.]|nr:hypothetical protein [Hanamia sp.]
MQATRIRQRLHHYVEKGDEKLLKLMYAIAKEYNDDDDFEYEFSAEELRMFEQRKAKRVSGESKTYGWEDAKDIITGKKKMQ